MLGFICIRDKLCLGATTCYTPELLAMWYLNSLYRQQYRCTVKYIVITYNESIFIYKNQQTRYIAPMLFLYWPIVFEVGPALKQHCCNLIIIQLHTSGALQSGSVGPACNVLSSCHCTFSVPPHVVMYCHCKLSVPPFVVISCHRTVSITPRVIIYCFVYCQSRLVL